jgi:AcrR family transcriptional regulator
MVCNMTSTAEPPAVDADAAGSGAGACGAIRIDRRARRSQATREAIRSAAMELVAEHGLEAVSVEQIAERADVGYRTFFNHFTCKEDALVASGAERALRITAALAARPADEAPLDALRAVICEGADAWIAEARATLSQQLAVIEANPSLAGRFQAEFAVMERSVAAAIAERCDLDVEHDLYPSLLAGVSMAALRASVHRWKRGDCSGKVGPLLTEAFDTLARGLTPPPATTTTTARTKAGAR